MSLQGVGGRLWGPVAVLLAFASFAPGATAATITPTTTNDQYNTGTECSLREAVQAANENIAFGGCPTGDASGVDTIALSGGVYTLTIVNTPTENNSVGDLDITTNIEIVSTSQDLTAIDGAAAADNVLEIGNLTTPITDVRIDGVEIQNGSSTNFAGGGLQVFDSTLTMVDSTVRDNFTNSSAGGFLVSEVNDSTVVDLSNVTISGNKAAGDGGGVYMASGTMNMNNVTVTGNQASFGLVDGGAGGGVYSGPSDINIANTIIAANIDPGDTVNAPDCVGPPISQGHNLIGDTTGCSYTPGTGDIVDQPAGLGPLAPNGGPTRTHAPLAGSPVINAANPSAPGSGINTCETTDQRGVGRPQAGRCDIGAFELQDPPASPPADPPPDDGSTDTAPPDTHITDAPKKRSKRRNATFRFTSPESGMSFECKLDDGAFQACASPKTYKVKPGKHSFQVRAKDAAGNTDPTPASETWNVAKKKK
jgi:CSLREA domain-containing protein